MELVSLTKADPDKILMMEMLSQSTYWKEQHLISSIYLFTFGGHVSTDRCSLLDVQMDI